MDDIAIDMRIQTLASEATELVSVEESLTDEQVERIARVALVLANLGLHHTARHQQDIRSLEDDFNAEVDAAMAERRALGLDRPPHYHDTDSAETGFCSGCGRTDLQAFNGADGRDAHAS